MATIFENGFESGDFTDFHTVDSACSIVTSPVRDGVYAAAVPAGSYGFRMGGGWGQTEVTARFDLRIERQIGATEYHSTIANVEDSTGSDVAYLRAMHYPDGRITLWNRKISGGSGNLPGEYEIQPDTWYRISFRLRIGAGDGVIEILVDGVSALLHENLDLGVTTIDQFMLYNASTGAPRTSYFDRINILDAFESISPAPPTGLGVVIL